MTAAPCPKCGADLCEHGVFWYVEQIGSVEVNEAGVVVVDVRGLGDAHRTRCSACGEEISDEGWEYV